MCLLDKRTLWLWECGWCGQHISEHLQIVLQTSPSAWIDWVCPPQWLQNNQVQCRATVAKAVSPLFYWRYSFHQKGKMYANCQDRIWNSVVQILVLYSLLVYAMRHNPVSFPHPTIFSIYEREKLNGEYLRDVLGNLCFLLVKKHQLL